MDSFRNKRWIRIVALTVALMGLLMGGCQLLVPRNGWNKKKWGPMVPHTNFPGDCGICHLPDRWDKLRDDFAFDHEKETGYRLEGSHIAAACLRCHNDRGPVQAYVARGCSGCHLDPHASTLGLECERCHSQISWEPTGLISEHARTRFPLVGIHSIATCESCHEGAAAGQFRGAPTQCEACHQADLAMATNPDHASNGWISNCQRCHLSTGWIGGFFGHEFFPLTGNHNVSCNECHTTGSPPAFDCLNCHDNDHPDVDGYMYNSAACYNCHPDGRADDD